MKVGLRILSVFSVLLVGLQSHAALLDGPSNSPYEKLQKASGEERAALEASFLKWAEGSSYTAKEKVALRALILNQNSGDEVLEALNQDLINWFYGFEDPRTMPKTLADMTHKVARTKNLSVDGCKQYRLCVVVDKSEQKIFAYEYGRQVQGVYGQPVSTARKGKSTPTGTFTIGELAGKNRRSNLYKGAYLGYAMQLHGNIFIHATSTDNYGKLGRPASAGCVRLHLDVAEQLNRLMRSVGRSSIRVIVRS